MRPRLSLRVFHWLSSVLLLLPLAALQPPPAQPAAPNLVTFAPMPPNITWGGRAVAVTVNPTNNQQVIVASESGGLFKTINGGNSWFHLNNLPMFRLIDVKYAPSNPNVVIATGWSDSHATNQGGIWRSTDGGATWSKPAGSNPPAGGSCPTYASTYGLSFEPGSNRVYVGTDCGLAISPDLGATWPTHTVPFAASYRIVVAAAATANGPLYLCGPNGFQRSPNNGGSFGTIDGSHSCSSPHGLSVSPLESNVVFVARNVTGPGCGPNGTPGRAGALFEGDVDGGGNVTWNQVSPTTCLGVLGRNPWVVVNRAANGDNSKIDVWYSDGLNVYWKRCGSGGATARCGTGQTGWSQSLLSHPDANHMAFDPVSAGPWFAVHDGGIDRAVNLGLPDLLGGGFLTIWLRNGAGPGGYNAQQIYDLAGQIGPYEQVDLYFGTQDNGMWASGDRGVTWPGNCCNEGGNLQVPRYADAARQVAFTDYGSGTNLISDRYFGSPTGWRNPLTLAQDAPTLLSSGVYIQWKQPNGGVTSTLAVTTDWGNTWNDTAAEIVQGRVGSPYVVFSGGEAILYQMVMSPFGVVQLVKVRGIQRDGSYSGVTVQQLFDSSLGGLPNIPPGEGALGFQQVLGVDPFNPNHLIAPDLFQNRMEVSYNGGLTWTVDSDLTNLVVGYNPISGTDEFLFAVGFAQYGGAVNPPGTGSQAHVIAFDPFHRGRVIVGTEAAGIFISDNGGDDWEMVPGSRQITGITDMFFIENSHSYTRDTVIVSTYGRGLWRLTIPLNTRRPFELPDNIANLWSSDWIRDPVTGDLVDPDLLFNPDWCPACRLYVVRKGELHDLTLDDQGVVIGANVSLAGVLGSTTDGYQFLPNLELKITGSYGPWEICPACLDTLEQLNGVIKGFVTDDTGKLLAYIGGTGELPGEDDLWPSDPIAPEDAPAYQAPTDPYIMLITEHLYPQPSAGREEEVEVKGFNFCSGGPCSAVSLYIGDRLIADNIAPDGDGAFELEFDVDEPFGYYPVLAQQALSAIAIQPSASNSATAWLAVGLGGDETDEEEHPYTPSVTWLPLVVR